MKARNVRITRAMLERLAAERGLVIDWFDAGAGALDALVGQRYTATQREAARATISLSRAACSPADWRVGVDFAVQAEQLSTGASLLDAEMKKLQRALRRKMDTACAVLVKQSADGLRTIHDVTYVDTGTAAAEQLLQQLAGLRLKP